MRNVAKEGKKNWQLRVGRHGTMQVCKWHAQSNYQRILENNPCPGRGINGD